MKSKFFLFRWTGSIFWFFARPFVKPAMKLINLVMNKARKSIRAELILTFGVCMLGALIVYGMSNSYLSRNYVSRSVDYTESMRNIAHQAASILEELNRQKFAPEDKDKINDFINRRYGNYSSKVLITDLGGKVLFKSNNVSETQVDILAVIKNAMEINQLGDYGNNYRFASGQRNEFVSFYPLSLKDTPVYLIVKGIPEGRIVTVSRGSQDSFLALLIAVGAFVTFFIFITNRKMKYIVEISSGIVEISKGNLKYRIVRRGEDELSMLADYINHMAEEIEGKIEVERKAERTKNELITNVSHDLRTPLTSVMGYLGLIKEKKYSSEEQMSEYLGIAVSKTEKLKALIEDLFEYAKLTNEGIRFYPRTVNLNEFLEQLSEELIPMCEENELNMIRNIPPERYMVNVDPDKVLRVFENLITNAIKYSYKPGDITISMYKAEDEVLIRVRNKGQSIPQEELPRLFERFYRVDKSRTAASGGSGLGLAIAKNIVDLSGGRIWAECEDEDISFFVSFKTQTS